MYKRSFFKNIIYIFLFSILVYFSPFNTIYGVENTENNSGIEQIENVENNENNIESSEEIRRKELNKVIKEILQNLKEKLKSFDEKLEVIRKTDEYINYPAIRLNIDTPIFGLDTMIESKLKITKDVATTDIANSYSIRTIIKNNSIRLPDSKFGGLVLTTREVKFVENITLNDANTSIIKLIQYEKTLDNIDTFIDDQVNKFFKGYIPKDKNQNIENISVRLDRLDSLMLEQDDKIINIEILYISDDDKSLFLEKLNEFNNLSNEIKKERKEIANMLLSYEDITDIQKRLLDVETTMSIFSKELDDMVEKKKNFDVLSTLNNLKENLVTRKNKIEEYINNSVEKIKVEQIEDAGDGEKIENNNDNVKDEKSNLDNEVFEEKTVYEITLDNVLEELNEYILLLKEMINQYEKVDDGIKLDENVSAESNMQVEEISENKNEIAQNLKEKEEILKEIQKIYNEFISKENKFYIDNVNLMLINTTNIVSELFKYTNSDLIDKMQYIYLELPNNLEKYLSETNIKFSIELKELSNKLSNILKELVYLYIETNEIYDKFNVDDIKNKA